MAAPKKHTNQHNVMMKPIFVNENLEGELRKKGYVVVPFIQEDTIQDLLRLFHCTNKEYTSRRLYETSRTNTPELTHEITKQIYQAFEAPAKRYFRNFKLYGGSFIAKTHLNTQEFRLHQDWNVVDEEKVNSALVWCPLVNVTIENGALFVIEGSHNLFNHIRSGSFPPLRVSVNDELRKYYKPVPVKAGHALIFYDRLFHGSYPNVNGELRVVAQGRVMQDDGEFVYFHKEQEGVLGMYHVDTAFYSDQINLLDKGEMPENIKPIKTISYRQPPLTLERLLEGLQSLSTVEVPLGGGVERRGV